MSEKSAPIVLQPMGSSSHLPTGSFSQLPSSSSQAAPSSPAPPAPMPHPDPAMDLPPAYPEPSYEAHARTPTPPSAPKLTPAQIGEQYRAERASTSLVLPCLADIHLCSIRSVRTRRARSDAEAWRLWYYHGRTALPSWYHLSLVSGCHIASGCALLTFASLVWIRRSGAHVVASR